MIGLTDHEDCNEVREWQLKDGLKRRYFLTQKTEIHIRNKNVVILHVSKRLYMNRWQNSCKFIKYNVHLSPRLQNIQGLRHWRQDFLLCCAFFSVFVLSRVATIVTPLTYEYYIQAGRPELNWKQIRGYWMSFSFRLGFIYLSSYWNQSRLISSIITTGISCVLLVQFMVEFP